MNFYWLPCIEAAIAISTHDPEKAILILRAAASYEMGVPKSFTNVAAYPIYLRAEAYLEAGRGADAEAEFLRLQSYSGLLANYPLGSLARLGLAWAYRLQARAAGDAGAASSSAMRKSEAAHKELLQQLWKNADASNPLRAQAQSEFRTVSLIQADK